MKNCTFSDCFARGGHGVQGGGEQLARDHGGGGDQGNARDSLIIMKDQDISYELLNDL